MNSNCSSVPICPKSAIGTITTAQVQTNHAEQKLRKAFTDDFTIRKSWANFQSTTADRTSRHGKIRMMRHCLTWSLLCASKEQWKARRHNTYANAHWLHATTCYDVTYVAVSGRCGGSSKEAFCLWHLCGSWVIPILEHSISPGCRTCEWQTMRFLNVLASFDAANPKGSKWMWCSLESSEEHCSRLEKNAQSKQDQQNFLLWLSLIRIVQTSVTKKQMITNATLVGKFFSPPSSSITRLRSHNLKSPRGRGDYLEVFLFLELKHKISSTSVNFGTKRHWDWGQRFGKFMKIPLDGSTNWWVGRWPKPCATKMIWMRFRLLVWS